MSEAHDRLDSWKAIAEYLDRDPTTVMRWAKERGLPVYVVPGQGQRHRAVYAYKGEIDAWLKKPAPQGLRADERKNQSEIPREARNDKWSADESPPGVPGDAGSGNGVISRARFSDFRSPMDSIGVQNSDLAPLGMTTVTNGSLSSRPGRRRSLWAVLVGGALLAAIAAGAWLRLPGPEPKVLGIEQLTNDGFEKNRGVATDGARVYFVENSRDGYVLSEIPSTGGSPVAIARANVDSAIQDISPDRTELLLIQDGRFRPGSVWILTLLAGSARRLGSIQAFSAAWSPDGAALAYTTDDGLYLCDSNGLSSRRIVGMSGRLDSVRWSPGGRELSFRRNSSKQVTLWKVGRDGRGLYPLCAGWDVPGEGPSCLWAPDGRYLILTASRAGHQAPWVLRISTGLLKRNDQATCFGPVGLELSPATMSPDGSRLYCLAGTRSRFETERFSARSKQLLPYLPDVPAAAIDFTKDGKWLAYVDDKGWLWKARNDGSGKVQLTLPPMSVELPRWSPDGQWIAFMGRKPGRPWKVRLVSAEGGPYEPVTSTQAAEGAPTWSPDGSRLAFGGLVDPRTRSPGPLLIHIFDLKERRLSVVPGSEGLWTARWSPDGRHIAALTEDSHSLMLFDFHAGKWTKLLNLGQILDLHWSRQGESIYLTNVPPEGELALFRVRVPGHRAERLIDLKRTASSGWLGLAPDDSPLVTRRVNSQEIYALQCQFPK